jgi:hypothetical protein
MNKIMLALLVLTASYVVSAQETVVYKGQSSGFNTVYGIPEPILIKFLAVHTDPVLATWETKNGWWHAAYNDNETSVTHVYYSRQPYYLVPIPGRDVDFKVILPVISTYVPPYVVTTAVKLYGAQLYSITKLKMEGDQDIYQVSLINDGNIRTVWMNPDFMASAGKRSSFK